MYFPTKRLTQGGIDHFMARKRPFAGKILRYDDGFEMRPVIALDHYIRAAETGADQLLYLMLVHQINLPNASAARRNKVAAY